MDELIAQNRGANVTMENSNINLEVKNQDTQLAQIIFNMCHTSSGVHFIQCVVIINVMSQCVGESKCHIAWAITNYPSMWVSISVQE